jgi:hypothetical protein
MADMTGMRHEEKFAAWTKLISQCIQSGKPVKAWCRENGVDYGRYRYWLKLAQMTIASLRDVCMEIGPSGLFPIGEEAEAIAPATDGLPGLVRVSMQGRATATWGGIGAQAAAAPAMSIRVGTSVCEIYNGADAGTIESALRALAGASC